MMREKDTRFLRK